MGLAADWGSCAPARRRSSAPWRAVAQGDRRCAIAAEADKHKKLTTPPTRCSTCSATFFASAYSSFIEKNPPSLLPRRGARVTACRIARSESPAVAWGVWDAGTNPPSMDDSSAPGSNFLTSFIPFGLWSLRSLPEPAPADGASRFPPPPHSFDRKPPLLFFLDGELDGDAMVGGTDDPPASLPPSVFIAPRRAGSTPCCGGSPKNGDETCCGAPCDGNATVLQFGSGLC